MGEFTQFYCCYCLQSVENRQSFYVGSTPNPPRRLRQHNGELVRGGAYRTKRKGTRPWEMIMIVYGFPNKIVALQFEHAWQHGYKTRFIKSEDRLINKKNSGSAGRNIHYKMALVRQLLNHSFFKFMDLGVQFFNSDMAGLWDDNKFRIQLDPYYEEWERIQVSEDAQSLVKYDLKKLSIDDLVDISSKNKNLVSNFYDKSLQLDKIRLVRYTESLMKGAMECQICDLEFDYTSEREVVKPFIAFCIDENCDFISHLKCICQKFIDDDESSSASAKELTLIPRYGKCPKCDTKIEWTTIVKYSALLKDKCSE